MYTSRSGGNGDRLARLGPEHLARRRDQLGEDHGGGSGGGGAQGGAGRGGRPVGGAAGGAGWRWGRAAARARRRGPDSVRLANRASRAWSLRRWFLPVTGCGGSSASAERTTSQSANRPWRAGPRPASATRPMSRSSAGVVADAV